MSLVFKYLVTIEVVSSLYSSKCCYMTAPVRARKRKVAQSVTAAVEPTVTGSRAVTTLATTSREWEETVERRLLQSHQLLQEMHQMMSEQRDHGDARHGTQSSADFMTPLTDLPQEALPFCAPGRAASGQVDGATGVLVTW